MALLVILKPSEEPSSGEAQGAPDPQDWQGRVLAGPAVHRPLAHLEEGGDLGDCEVHGLQAASDRGVTDGLLPDDQRGPSPEATGGL